MADDELVNILIYYFFILKKPADAGCENRRPVHGEISSHVLFLQLYENFILNCCLSKSE